jgi:hypothetical protein
MKNIHLIALLLVVLDFSLRAAEFDELKENVRLRARSLQEMKERGLAREGSDGLLQPGVGPIEATQRGLLDAENADRARLFDLIAARTKTTRGEVVAQFARQAQARETVASTTANSNTSSTPERSNPQSDKTSSSPLIGNRTGVLPMKVLTRPFSNIYDAPSAEGKLLRENVPAFTIFYVYQDKKQEGWYQVGSDTRGGNLGWMKADDVIEWKQNLVVQFTHPDERKPVLLFREEGPLSQLVALPKATRAAQVDQLYETVKSGRPPANFPVSSMEPRREINSKDFYLLPIVDFREDEIDGREGRLLKLAAATRQRGATDFASGNAGNINREIDPTKGREIKVDLVFVMDLTLSMQPFATRTLQMIQNCVQQTGADAKVVSAIRFGLWGYRDSPEICGKSMEWNTHNFTEDLQPLNDFAVTLGGVRATTTDSIDFEEDVLSGVADAVEKTKWRDGAIHQLILVGDAPGREPKKADPFDTHRSHPIGTAREKSAAEIRTMADKVSEGKGVYVSAIYLKSSPKWAKYEQIGTEQFSILSRNRNDLRGHGNFRLLNATDSAIYGATAQSLADGILEAVRAAQSGRTSDLAEPPKVDAGGGSPNVETEEAGKTAGREMAKNMFRGAFVDYLATVDAPKPPNDVTVWASDKDLLDPVVRGLEPQILLTKKDLNSLKLMLDSVINAGLRGKITGEDLFKALQAVIAAAVSDPGQISSAESLVATGLTPKFLQGLPYRSRLMTLTEDSWRRMSADSQDQFLQDLDNKLHMYQTLHDQKDANWHKLNPDDDDGNKVINVPLDALP